MKFIDFERHGNVVRYYLGADDLEKWWGDDWNDSPYEHNAGTVYPEYCSGHVDVAYPFDALVYEPSCGHWNSPWCKKNMMLREVPMIASLFVDNLENSWSYDENFDVTVAHDKAHRVYMGDSFDADNPSASFPAYAVVLSVTLVDNER